MSHMANLGDSGGIYDKSLTTGQTAGGTASGAATGLMAGAGLSTALIASGATASSTGIGAIVGIPLLLAGLAAGAIAGGASARGKSRKTQKAAWEESRLQERLADERAVSASNAAYDQQQASASIQAAGQRASRSPATNYGKIEDPEATLASSMQTPYNNSYDAWKAMVYGG